MAHRRTTMRSVTVTIFLLVGATGVSAATASPNEGDNSLGSVPPPIALSLLEDPHCLFASPNASSAREGGGIRRPSLNVIPVPLLSAPDVSVEEFRAERLSPPGGALPLHIIDLHGVDPSDWTRPKLRELCGDAPLMEDDECEHDDEDDVVDEDCHSVKAKKRDAAEREWGGLESANLAEWGIKTWGELMDRQDTREGRGLYLHDASIVDMCPEALDMLPGMPKYFPRDYNLFEDLDHEPNLANIELDDENFWDAFANYIHFPSIFIGKGGSSGSRLHSDAGLTRAFMLHLSGRKVWRLVAPKDHQRLYPSGPSEAGVYTVDLFDPDFEAHPLLDGLTVYEAVAEPGDVVFFPEGWPHQVRNLDDTVAVSVNFVDNGNLDAVAELIRQDEGGEDNYLAGFAASFFAPLDDPPFTPDAAGTDFIPFRTFVKNQVVRSMEGVPTAALRLAEEGRNATRRSGGGDQEDGGGGAPTAGGLGEHRDRYGRTPLHSAAKYNIAPVVKYLLDDVGMDPNAMDDCGRTPLCMAKSPNDEVAVMLKQRGGERKITGECKRTLKRKREEKLKRLKDNASFEETSEPVDGQALEAPRTYLRQVNNNKD